MLFERARIAGLLIILLAQPYVNILIEVDAKPQGDDNFQANSSNIPIAIIPPRIKSRAFPAEEHIEDSKVIMDSKFLSPPEPEAVIIPPRKNAPVPKLVVTQHNDNSPQKLHKPVKKQNNKGNNRKKPEKSNAPHPRKNQNPKNSIASTPNNESRIDLITPSNQSVILEESIKRVKTWPLSRPESSPALTAKGADLEHHTTQSTKGSHSTILNETVHHQEGNDENSSSSKASHPSILDRLQQGPYLYIIFTVASIILLLLILYSGLLCHRKMMKGKSDGKANSNNSSRKSIANEIQMGKKLTSFKAGEKPIPLLTIESVPYSVNPYKMPEISYSGEGFDYSKRKNSTNKKKYYQVNVKREEDEDTEYLDNFPGLEQESSLGTIASSHASTAETRIIQSMALSSSASEFRAPEAALLDPTDDIPLSNLRWKQRKGSLPIGLEAFNANRQNEQMNPYYQLLNNRFNTTNGIRIPDFSKEAATVPPYPPPNDHYGNPNYVRSENAYDDQQTFNEWKQHYNNLFINGHHSFRPTVTMFQQLQQTHESEIGSEQHQRESEVMSEKDH